MYYDPNLTYPCPTHTSWNIQDSSKIKTFMECQRKYFYEYVIGWKDERPSNHLIFGSAWHEAMAHLYTHGFSPSSIQEAFNEGFLPYYRRYIDPGEDELYFPKTPQRALMALIYYTEAWKDDLIENEVLEYNGKKLIEIGGKISISDRYSVAFRQDTILRGPRGIFSLEHKTGSSSYGWDTQWKLNPATAIYSHVLYCLFPPEEVAGIKYNGMIFKKTKDDAKKDLKEPFRHFEVIRAPIYKSTEDMASMLVNIIWWLDSISAEFSHLSQCSPGDDFLACFPQNWTACQNWGRACEYHDFCCFWRNPLKHLDRLPMGMKVEFWDPTKEPVKVEVSL